MDNNFIKGFLSASILISMILFAGFVWADTNGIWNRAEDTRGGIFGGDEQDVTSGYSFINPVTFNEPVTMNSNLSVDVITSTSGGNVIIQLG